MLPGDLYTGVPTDQIDHLFRFRASHPCKFVNQAGVKWEYIACGQGQATVLLLPGGLFIAEHVFGYIDALESAYRIIVPSYPPIESIDQLVDGVAAVLDEERAPQVFVWGQSYSGMVAQVFAQRHPARVKKLILTGAGPLSTQGPLAVVIPVLA